MSNISKEHMMTVLITILFQRVEIMHWKQTWQNLKTKKTTTMSDFYNIYLSRNSLQVFGESKNKQTNKEDRFLLSTTEY